MSVHRGKPRSDTPFHASWRQLAPGRLSLGMTLPGAKMAVKDLDRLSQGLTRAFVRSACWRANRLIA